MYLGVAQYDLSKYFKCKQGCLSLFVFVNEVYAQSTYSYCI